MSFKLVEKDNDKYILDNCDEVVLSKERDINDLISKCFEHTASKLLLHQKSISDDFFDLKTGFAGELLQKLVNYKIKLALVIPTDYPLSDRFKELILETNRLFVNSGGIPK